MDERGYYEGSTGCLSVSFLAVFTCNAIGDF